MKPAQSKELKRLRNPFCSSCELFEKASNVCVMGEGSYKLPIFVVGEAPGSQEDAAKRPFVGRAGKLLRSSLIAVGIHPSRVYLTNVAKCWPQGTPTEDQADACSSRYLQEEFRILSPLYVLALGSTALKTLTSERSITDARGKIHPCSLSDNSFVYPTYHPAYILRRNDLQGQFEADLEDFKLLVDLDSGNQKT